MFLNTSQKEHLDHILNFVKPHLFGIINMQVLFLFNAFFQSSFFERFPIISALLYFCPPFDFVDVEFGRLQAKDMLQHLWTGPISNASVDVVQGGRSVEVRAVGVTKVTAYF